jgi:hypothetical protein
MHFAGRNIFIQTGYVGMIHGGLDIGFIFKPVSQFFLEQDLNGGFPVKGVMVRFVHIPHAARPDMPGQAVTGHFTVL